ncbi:hypothetical protein [Alienimonas chondri]|uniref:HEAT repeat domain-containing protein n=1 Tax=Alienimonas chondri TaxID=2681879 RepID=A0ABX1VDK4_9PLAN|nr:hypothetical protein [Alienimonas chondri]NNJ26173.1 hypothetical protein [Alienimonas chondri]
MISAAANRADADPLAGLDDVPWADLTHAYGSASDVPDLLRALETGPEDAADRAMHDLFGNIWHQGTVYPATPHAVPFLLNLLAEEPPWAEQIAVLLGEIADGHGYMLVHASSLSSLRFNYEKIAADRGTTVEAEMAAERTVIAACRAAVAAGAEALAPFLIHTEGRVGDEYIVRETVARGLARCAAIRPEMKDWVLDALAEETDPRMPAELDGRVDDLPWLAAAVKEKCKRLGPADWEANDD